MDELKKLVNAGNWNLALDITVRGITIAAAALGTAPADAQGDDPVQASAHHLNETVLSLRTSGTHG